MSKTNSTNRTEILTPMVKTLLRKKANLRSNDNKLVAAIWKNEIGNKSTLDNLTASDFLKMLESGKLSNYDTITRARRKAQQADNTLR
jgi:hypothetical protein